MHNGENLLDGMHNLREPGRQGDWMFYGSSL